MLKAANSISIQQEYGITSSSLVSLLKLYGKIKSLSSGKSLHDFIVRSGYEQHQFLANSLIDMYGSCGTLRDALAVFESMSNPNVYSWNVLLNAYGKHSSLEEARTFFDRIPNPDVCSWNTLIKLVSQHGCFDDTWNVFNKMPVRNLVSWNAMISASICQKEHYTDALYFLMQMLVDGVHPDKFTFVSTIDACTSLRNVQTGKMLHVLAFNTGCEQDLMVGTALINMYGKCNRPSEATTVFQQMSSPDSFAWTSIISALSSSNSEKALSLFYTMFHKEVNVDIVTYVCALDACASSKTLKDGRLIHSAVVQLYLDANPVIATSLIDMYGKGESIKDARYIFYNMRPSDPISWTVMIGALAQSQEYGEALQVFHRMNFEGFCPDEVTFVCTLDACADLAILYEGQEIHSAILFYVFEQDIVVGNNLINMYGKCGCPMDARRVFDLMPSKNILSWNTMLGTYALSGNSKEAFLLFDDMKIKNIQPDDVTYLSVLGSCSHAGHVEYGICVFISMYNDHGVKYTKEHYVCMIDLLGRSGQLNEAELLITNMPSLENISMVWLCLLGACRTHGDVNRGVRAANCSVILDPADPAPCVALLNFLSDSRRWKYETEELDDPS